MKKTIGLAVKFILVLAVLLISFKLRYKNYDQVPIPGQSLDEYSYSWVGMSLIRLGVPIGFSGINGYKKNDFRYINVDRIYQNTGEANPIPINMPWFDHPPLLGLITGGYAYLKGARVFEDAGVFIIRKPMLYLGTLAVFLVFLIGLINFNYLTGLVSALIYGTIPIVVIGSRMVQGENGMVPFFLLTLLLYSLYKKTKSDKLLFAAAVAAGTTCLFKLSGAASIISVLILLFGEKTAWKIRFKKMMFFGIIAFSFIFLFLVYGAAYDWDTFVKIIFSNSNRYYGLGPGLFYNLIIEHKITNTKFFTEPWIISLWIAFFAGLSRKMKFGNKLIAISALSYLAVYVLLGSYSYGWYAIPFWPLLSVSLGRILVLAFNKIKYFILGILLLLIPFGFSGGRFIKIDDFQKYANIWRFSIALVLLLAAFGLSKNINKKVIILLRFILILIFLTSIYLNCKYINSIGIDQWYHVN